MSGPAVLPPTTTSRSPDPADSSPLARIAAPAMIVAGAGLVITQVVQFLTLDRDDIAGTVTSPVYMVNAMAAVVVYCALAVAVVAAHRWQEREAGTFGVVALVAALVGTVLLGGDYWFEGFATPWFADQVPGYIDAGPGGTVKFGGVTSFVLFSLGWVLFAAASWRARVFPVAVCAAIAAGGLIAVGSGNPPFGAPLGLALCWLGAWIARHRS